MFTYKGLPFSQSGRSGRKKSEFAVVGFPSDLGATSESGQAGGVRAIIARATPGVDDGTVVACGIVPPTTRDNESYMVEVEDAVADIARNTRCVVAIGGDDSVSLGVVRGLLHQYPDLGMLHYDAHSDQGPGELVTHANWVSFVQRSNVPVRQWGQRVTVDAAPLDDEIGTRPVAVVIDLDVIDPAYAPGVAVPYPFGCTPTELMARVTKDLEAVGKTVAIVVTETTQARDIGGITVHLACVLLERLMQTVHTLQ